VLSNKFLIFDYLRKLTVKRVAEGGCYNYWPEDLDKNVVGPSEMDKAMRSRYLGPFVDVFLYCQADILFNISFVQMIFIVERHGQDQSWHLYDRGFPFLFRFHFTVDSSDLYILKVVLNENKIFFFIQVLKMYWIEIY